MEPFKNIFNKLLVKSIATEISKYDNKFSKTKFTNECCKDLELLEMKDRVRLISSMLEKHMTGSYKTNVKVICKCLAPEVTSKGHKTTYDEASGLTGFGTWPLTQYIEDYGLDDFETSLSAMYELTQRFSAEFAIRPFIKKNDILVYKKLAKWVNDPNEHVRRLVSEGTRPSLPWGMKVDQIIQQLNRNVELITHLADDPSEYVRKSVANHLNDISHIDQNLFFSALSLIDHKTKNSEKIIRHASRTLLKNGNPKALKLHGYDPSISLKVSVKMSSTKVNEGDSFELNLVIDNKLKSSKEKKILIDYVIYYLKKNGTHSAKVFRLKDTLIRSELAVSKKIHMKKVTTRKHYKGIHYIGIQINGKEYIRKEFKLNC
jgi:3-methyladenine DNA glycosylase AlkC